MIVEFLLFCTLILVYFIMKDRKPATMPPGPSEIPFVGGMPIEKIKDMEAYREKYGKIYTTRVGQVRTVWICDYQLAKEAMASIELADRPELFRLFAINPEENAGVIASNGMQWVHERRFCLRHLRDLGMGKTQLEVAIIEEARALVENMKALKENPSTYPASFRTCVLNVVWQLVAGKRYELDSNEVDAVFDTFENFRETQSMMGFVEYFFPIVKSLPESLKIRWFNTDVMDNFRREMKKIIVECIEEHQQRKHEDAPSDLIAEYLEEMKNQSADADSSHSYLSLYQIISDLFAAGSDTVTNMLRWVVFFMNKYPQIAKKCQEELDREIPRDSYVSITDKPRLPYIEAFINEALRHASLIHFNVPREATKDFNLSGYFIPKGTNVTVSNYFVHYDQSYWKDPQNFRPERFLDDNGKFNAKLGRTFAFGSGRRQCLGEALARMEFFLFTAAILQNFEVELPAGRTLSERTREVVGARTLPDQEFIFRIRK